MLGAQVRWMEFLDVQYGPTHDLADVVRALEDEVAGAHNAAFPLGLHHEDHLTVAAACLEIVRRTPAVDWLLYEDVIYRATYGGTEERLAWLRHEGFDTQPVDFPVVHDKRQAVAAYTSQVAGLGELLLDAYEPERYWKIRPRT
jgi:LmbE family N-acetylglucosaminyl deacetylase